MALKSIGSEDPYVQTSNLEEMFQQFKKRFPTEEDCWIELIRVIQQNDIFRCRSCSGRQFKHLGGRKIHCANCYFATSITVGTLFERIRRIEPWLAAIWLMERGAVLTSSALHKFVDIAQSSALVMLRKIRVVLEFCFDETAKLMVSAQFKRLMCRRSLETPARLHPSAEDDFLDPADSSLHSPESERRGNFAQEADPIDQSDTSSDSQATIDALVRAADLEKHLEVLPDKLREKALVILRSLMNGPLSFDELCAQTALAPGPLNSVLAILEICGLIRDTGGARFTLLIRRSESRFAGYEDESVSGLRSQRTKHRGRGEQDRGPLNDSYDPGGPRPGPTSQALVNVKDMALAKSLIMRIARMFSGVSRKYLQLYLVAFWCCVDRSFWSADKILKHCYLSPPVPYQDSLKYVSSQLLKVRTGRSKL